MFVEDDDCIVDDNVGFSFENLNAKEAKRIVDALHDIEDRLFSNDAKESSIQAAEETIEEQFPVYTYYSMGYDATNEKVEDKELFLWQKQFPYLLVKGSSASQHCSHVDANTTGAEFQSVSLPKYCSDLMYFDDLNQKNESDCSNLVLIGKRMLPKNLMSATNLSVSPVTGIGEKDEEVFAKDGSLEEIIHMDLTQANSPLACWDPYSVAKGEIVSNLVDVLWPEVTDALAPLVHQVIELAKKYDMSVESSEMMEQDDDQEIFSFEE